MFRSTDTVHASLFDERMNFIQSNIRESCLNWVTGKCYHTVCSFPAPELTHTEMASVYLLLHACLVLILYVLGRDAQSIVLKPGDPIRPVSTGSGLAIRCEAVDVDPSEDPRLAWTSPQGNVVNSQNAQDTVHVEGRGTRVLILFIRNVTYIHTGNWTCSGVAGGWPMNKEVIFDVWEDISFNGSQNQRGKIYTDHTIHCEVGGSPQPVVYWTFEGNYVSGARHILKPEGLKILNITKMDEGDYDCKADIESRGRFAFHRIHFIVMIPPKLTRPPKFTSGIEGKELTMYCRASGDPPPKYEWYKQEISMRSQTEAMEKTVSIPRNIIQKDIHFTRLRDGGRYEISDVEGTMKIKTLVSTDVGVYKCRATNPVGNEEGRANVNVLVPPKIIRVDKGEGKEHEDLAMMCVANGNPAPELQWYKLDNPEPFRLGQTDSGSRVKIWQNKRPGQTTIEMTITVLQASDIGNYICFATNEAGNDTRLTSLNVVVLIATTTERVSVPVASIKWHHLVVALPAVGGLVLMGFLLASLSRSH